MTPAEIAKLNVGDRVRRAFGNTVAHVDQITERYIALRWGSASRRDILSKNSPLWSDLLTKEG